MPQTVSNAFCAAMTATSTSFGVASATWQRTWPVAARIRSGQCMFFSLQTIHAQGLKTLRDR